MNINPQQVHTFRVIFDAGEFLPPPYHYAYQLEVTLGEKETPAFYEINYLHREDLSEEEIFEEGFTLEDDWKWKGNLPEIWKEAIVTQIRQQSWPKNPDKPDEEGAKIEIQLIDAEGNKLFEGLPADIGSWEYFLQELSQAIYEIGEKEAPFHLNYREIGSGNEQLDIELKASFANRTISAKEFINTQEVRETNPEWKELKQLMKLIYLPDYDYEKARTQEPRKRGRYILTGEGLWFKFGESLTEPNKKANSLEKLEKRLKELVE